MARGIFQKPGLSAGITGKTGAFSACCGGKDFGKAGAVRQWTAEVPPAFFGAGAVGQGLRAVRRGSACRDCTCYPEKMAFLNKSKSSTSPAIFQFCPLDIMIFV